MLGRSSARAHVLGALVALLVPFGPAAADQNDPKLDELFTQLNRMQVETASARDVRRLEQEIWQTWYETENKAAKGFMLLGDRAMATGDIRFAVGAFARAIEQSPDLAEAWNRRATAYYMLSEYEKSLADVDRVIELEPRHFGALSGAGQIYMALGEKEKAVEALRRALIVNPHMTGPKRAVERLTKELEGDSI